MACKMCINVIREMSHNLNYTLFEKYIDTVCKDGVLSTNTCNIILSNSSSVYTLFISLIESGMICNQIQLCLFELISKFMYN